MLEAKVMNRFIVSARKYRPQLFSTVVGQSHITTTLKNAIRNKQLAHAFLFCGPRGVGKTTCARILAKSINCENPAADGEACNSCHSCVSFNEGSSLNIHELDAASNNSVDDIRSLVDQVRFAPQPGKYKVYIIDEVHMLSSSAFNAFLKTLEEPPPYAIFILATTEKHKILPTILSRCQVFDFKRITNKDIIDHLLEICEKENIPADKSSLELIAQKSEGCMRDALSIMDKMASFSNGKITYADTLEHLNILDESYYFKLLASVLGQQLSEALLIFDEINTKGFEGDLLINGFAEFIRNLLICKDEKAARLLEVVDDFKQKYIETAKTVDSTWLISALNQLSESEINYRAARNKRLHVELTLIKLSYLNQALHLSQAAPEKKRGTESVKPVAYRRIAPLEYKNEKSKSLKEIVIPANAGTESGETKSAFKEKARLIIEESKSPTSVNTSPGALSKIRQEVASRRNVPETMEVQMLDTQPLREAWNQFTAELKKNKNSAAQSFEGAELRILDELRFEILANNNLEQRFIEQEKNKLSELLQQRFRNKNISFSVVIREQSIHTLTQEKTLSKRDQFYQIAEMYPLVKELKDKLKLELDY
jgi:DNA polymerase-3 subunit gamma/tau